jgi:putative NIF3 family GTP cyclohydrolase 1 type 2
MIDHPIYLNRIKEVPEVDDGALFHYTNFDSFLKIIETMTLKSSPLAKMNDLNEASVEFMKLKLLPISPHLRIVNNYKVKTIKTVAFCAGSGSEFIEETPCDAFVTGDLKYHTAVESTKVVYDIGHFESEILAVPFLKELTGVGDKGIIADEESPFS